MLKKDESKVLKLLFDDTTKDWTIRAISKNLGQKYVQTYRTINNLVGSGIISSRTIGKSRLIALDLSRHHPEYVITEIERATDKCRNKTLKIIQTHLLDIDACFICILFGSYASGTNKPKSDIDLLFIISDTEDYGFFERKIKTLLSPYDCDINITTHKGLMEMWTKPNKLNVGNELLKTHIVLRDAEGFINLLRKHNAG